jgi:hypothetical protein
VVSTRPQTEEGLLSSVDAAVQADPTPLHTTLRWSREQLELVRCAAERYGMPYQTYVKDAAFRRALEDLHQLGVQPALQTPSRAATSKG